MRLDGGVVLVDLEHDEAGGALGVLHHVELQAARLVGETALGLGGHLLLELGFLAGLRGEISDDGAHGRTPWMMKVVSTTLARTASGVSPDEHTAGCPRKSGSAKVQTSPAAIR